MKVLITGGAGFIGSHLCDSFVARGEDVAILDNLSTGSIKNIAHLEGKIKVFQGDIRDQNLVESLIKDCDLVLHMAAALGVDNILENPIESISTNFNGSEVVLNGATKYNKRIVIASTSEIYGKNSNQPLSEDDDRVIGSPQKLRWSYSDAKALEEATAHSLFLSKNLKVTTIRLFNTVGPRQSGKYGMVIPRFIFSALNNKPLTVYGDGLQSRTFCHVSEVTDAIQLLLQNDESIGQVYNIGNTIEFTIRDLANKVINELKSSSKIKYLNYQEAYNPGFEETQRRVPNISKIRLLTKWEPKISLEEIIKDVANFFIKKI